MSTWAIQKLGAEPWLSPPESLTLYALPKQESLLRVKDVREEPVPTGWPLVRVADVAGVFDAAKRASPREPVVTGRDVDESTAQVFNCSTQTGFTVHPSADVKEGDILVPARRDRPCVLITPEHAGLAFSSQFLRVRPVGMSPMVLWVALNLALESRQTSGRLLASESETLSAPELAELELAVPPEGVAHEAKELLPVPAVHRLAIYSLRSRWHAVNLQGSADWRSPSAAGDASEASVPLSSLAKSWRQRPLRGTAPTLSEVEGPGMLPYVTGRSLRSPDLADRWVSETERWRIALPGCVLMSSVGPPHARWNEHPVVPSPHVIVLVMEYWTEHSALARRLAHYINSASGQLALRSVASSSVGGVPRLSMKDLQNVQVPPLEVLLESSPRLSTITVRLKKLLEVD